MIKMASCSCLTLGKRAAIFEGQYLQSLKSQLTEICSAYCLLGGLEKAWQETPANIRKDVQYCSVKTNHVLQGMGPSFSGNEQNGFSIVLFLDDIQDVAGPHCIVLTLEDCKGPVEKSGLLPLPRVRCLPVFWDMVYVRASKQKHFNQLAVNF